MLSHCRAFALAGMALTATTANAGVTEEQIKATCKEQLGTYSNDPAAGISYCCYSTTSCQTWVDGVPIPRDGGVTVPQGPKTAPLAPVVVAPRG